MTEEYKKVVDMIDKAIHQYYDLEVITKNVDLNNIRNMSPCVLKQSALKKYQHVMLVNFNGLGTGQVHFVTNDGHYMLLPWCYIVSMIPNTKVIKE